MMLRIALACGLVISCAVTAQAKTPVENRRFDPSRAVGCLLSEDWVRADLHELGLRPGMTALVRYGFGSIPGTSPDPLGQLQIIIYSPDRMRAWLFLTRAEGKESYVVIRNAYSLILSGRKWEASEGNGGIATYAAVSRYATGMGKQGAVRVRLVENPRGCSVEK